MEDDDYDRGEGNPCTVRAEKPRRSRFHAANDRSEVDDMARYEWW